MKRILTEFLLEALIDAALLAMTGRFSGARLRPARLMLGAVIGAGASRCAHAWELTGGQAALLGLPTALVMLIVAQGRYALERPARSVLLMLASAGLLGGTVYALAGATGSLRAAWLLGGGGVAAMAVNAARARHAADDIRRVRLRIWRGQYALHIEAIVDSGNTLRDYLTHRPVIVMPESAMRRLGLREGMPGLRPIFADTAGGRCMMWMTMPERCEIVLPGGSIVRAQAAAAFSPGLSASALVPASLICPESKGGKAYGIVQK